MAEVAEAPSGLAEAIKGGDPKVQPTKSSQANTEAPEGTNGNPIPMENVEQFSNKEETQETPPDPVQEAIDAGNAPQEEQKTSGEETGEDAQEDQQSSEQAETPEPTPKDYNSIKPEDLQNPQLRAFGNALLGAAPDLDIDRALGNALSRGDPSLIDNKYLEEVGGDNADNIKQIAKGLVDVAVQESTQLEGSIHEMAGGQQNWQTAAAVFNNNAPEAMKKYAINALNSFNQDQIKDGAQLILDYANQQGAMTKESNMVEAEASKPSSSNQSKGLSKAQFQEAIAGLNPDSPDVENKRNELYRLRHVGKERGI